MIFADSQHPSIQALARDLTNDATTDAESIEAIYGFVRDEVKFAFLPEIDALTASQVLEQRKGQCNNKSTLFLALLRAAGFTARIHFSTISKQIHRGLFPRLIFSLVPDEISHSWVEVEHEGSWRVIDGYINDRAFFLGSKQTLIERGWTDGLSVSCGGGDAAADDSFSLESDRFVQMGAVREDHGVWEDPGAYLSSADYRNNPNPIKRFIYRLAIPEMNARIEALRALA